MPSSLLNSQPVVAPHEAPQQPEVPDQDIYHDTDDYESEDAYYELGDDLEDGAILTSANITQSFNRERQMQGGVVRSNAQKPTANTSSQINDTDASLARHAAKIKLDGGKEGKNRTKDKSDRATSELVMDDRTRVILYKMIQQNHISGIHGAISTGKEANVYNATLEPEDDDAPPIQRAIKIYKTSILVFKDREKYVTGEHRFNSASKGNNLRKVKQWAEKEFRNLKRLRAAGIPCPEPLLLKSHVLLMEFLGDKRGYAYPKLREATFSQESQEGSENPWRPLYIQLLGLMRKLYQVCKLVHADLSEYNILYHDNKLYIIDVSQSVEHDHPRALEFLRIDIKNVGDFFRRMGVDTLQDRTIFDFIISPEGPLDEPELSQAIEHLYETRPQVEDSAEAEAKREIDNEVFRNQFIPRTLDDVYDIERDSQQPQEGLIYKQMLADKVVTPQAAPEEESDDESEGESHSGGSNGSHSDESIFKEGRSRGKKHVDKDEKAAHKKAVKEENAAKRANKLPKAKKKRLIATTSSRRRK
ncbi:RIO1 family-domain-containing protein [Podospora fimiseda]|uniref:Serine/threonine-protein kinase RIO1 n=1 Tax=Podospora fimiseda TaxID=252190 RepID=A0AAN7GXM5_9PEZI|nr:RIO1 family-domain-containing protein [Podospora fimiseda]